MSHRERAEPARSYTEASMRLGCIVIAGGYGSVSARNGEPYPKILEDIGGTPMFVRPIISAEAAGVRDVAVVANPRTIAPMRDALHRSFKKKAIRAMPVICTQEDRYGAAHAASLAIPILMSRGVTHALIAYGDMPLWSTETITQLIQLHQMDPLYAATMAIVRRTPDYPALDRYGRVVFDSFGLVSRVVEVSDKNMTNEERALPWVNPSFWIWRLGWLSRHVLDSPEVERFDGHSRERYLPPLVQIATEQGQTIREYLLPEARVYEAIGVNSPEELSLVRSLAVHA